MIRGVGIVHGGFRIDTGILRGIDHVSWVNWAHRSCEGRDAVY